MKCVLMNEPVETGAATGQTDAIMAMMNLNENITNIVLVMYACQAFLCAVHFSCHVINYRQFQLI